MIKSKKDYSKLRIIFFILTKIYIELIYIDSI